MIDEGMMDMKMRDEGLLEQALLDASIMEPVRQGNWNGWSPPTLWNAS